jgi:hypothetical protein
MCIHPTGTLAPTLFSIRPRELLSQLHRGIFDSSYSFPSRPAHILRLACDVDISALIMGPAISIRVETGIKAPASVVWSLLTDTSTYPSWNKFVSSADILDAQPDDPHPEILRLHSRRRFHATIHGFKAPSVERVTIFETPDESQNAPRVYRVGWVVEGFPNFVFSTLRTNEVEEVQGEDGPECVYRTGMDQSGPMGYATKLFVGGAVQRGIQQWADDLKVAAEERATGMKANV